MYHIAEISALLVPGMADNGISHLLCVIGILLDILLVPKILRNSLHEFCDAHQMHAAAKGSHRMLQLLLMQFHLGRIVVHAAGVVEVIVHSKQAALIPGGCRPLAFPREKLIIPPKHGIVLLEPGLALWRQLL